MSDHEAEQMLMREVLTGLGARVEVAGDLLEVSLREPEGEPPEAAAERAELIHALGGAESLTLCFRSEDLAPGRDLAGPGSFVLGGVERLMRRRGRRATLRAPRRHRADRRRGLAAVADGVGLGKRREATRLDSWWTFRVRLPDPDRPQRLVVVRVTEGREVAEVHDQLPLEELRGYEDTPRVRLDVKVMKALAARASEAAEAEMRRQLEPLEAAALRALRRELAQVEGFYRAGLEEARKGRRDPTGARARDLELQRRRRLADLVAGRALEAEIEPLQRVVVVRPAAAWPLSAQEVAQDREVVMDLHSGEILTRPVAHGTDLESAPSADGA